MMCNYEVIKKCHIGVNRCERLEHQEIVCTDFVVDGTIGKTEKEVVKS